MTNTEIENEILKQLYQWWETHSGSSIYAIFDKLENVGEKQFSRVADDLEDKQLISGVGQGCPCNITCYGVQATETLDLIDSQKVNRYREIRYKVLETAFYAFEKEGKYGEFCVNDSFEENNFEKIELYINTDFLCDYGLINSVSTCCYKITEAGREQFNLWQQNSFLHNEFERISHEKPQQRGREFQKLISKVCEISGWKQEESVSTSYEEMDVIIHKDREFYLVECKWEKKPIQPIAINHLLGKLNKRADTKGIVISMSGFTSGAVDDVVDSTTQKLILLFGKEDIEQIISNPASFEELLNYKYTELVSRRKAIWK